jgi:hypothetical protein
VPCRHPQTQRRTAPSARRASARTGCSTPDRVRFVVADAPPGRFGEASIQRGLHDLKWLSRCAVAHEAVVEYFVGARAVIPMKLFTIFESDSRALAEIARNRRQLDRSIRHVAGGREWGVRIRAVPDPVAVRPVRLPRKIESGASAWRRRSRRATRPANAPSADGFAWRGLHRPGRPLR